MPEPLLHLGDVGLMVERVGGRRGPQGVRAEPLDVHPHTLRVVLHHLVDPVRGHRPLHCPARVVLHRPEEGAAEVLAVSHGFEVVGDELRRPGMRGQVRKSHTRPIARVLTAASKALPGQNQPPFGRLFCGSSNGIYTFHQLAGPQRRLGAGLAMGGG